ncbi:hypothetical protein LPW26_17270 [Rhodopseudomonas sp. HC1]|nr:hypothetical protein [Rhodopseudomonas infernalis]
MPTGTSAASLFEATGRIIVKKRRNRTRQQLSLEERLSLCSERWKREADESGNVEIRGVWQERARSAEAARGIIAWLQERENSR